MDKNTIKEFAKDNFNEGTEGYEIVVMLLALVKQGKLVEEDVLDIMNYVYDDNSEGVLNSLVKAKSIVSDDVLNDILNGVG